MKLRTILTFFFFLSLHLAKAQYTIKGKVNLGPDWQPKIYMAAINKLSDYNRTSPDMIVNTAEIDVDGNFVLEGDNLPEVPQYYRIYLMKTQNTDYDACFYAGDDHNFAHVLLSKGAKLELQANANTVAPLGDYQIVGDQPNHLMRQLARIMFPSFYFHRIKFPTELKFAENKLHVDLKSFADTCQNTLVALAAVTNTDFDEYFDRDVEFYQAFGERLKAELPNSRYTKNYLLRMKYYANEEVGFPMWATILLSLLILTVIGLVYQLMKYQGRIRTLENQLQDLPKEEPSSKTVLTDLLTQKEKEILRLIGEGKSNKEIASALFVELSTVKTHINKIYSKIGVSNRKEAQKIANQLVSKRV